MSRNWAHVVAVTLIAMSASAAEPAELPHHISKASLPELYVLKIANPFPTLYVMNAQGRLVVQGRGKEAPVFEFDFSKLKDRPLPQSESVQRVEDYLSSYNEHARDQAPDAHYFFYFFKLDPESFGGQKCEPCEELEGQLIENIKDLSRQVYLEVILVTNP